MRILVLGAGLQGSACAYDLLEQEDVDRVVLADREPGGVAFLPADERLERRRLDFRDHDAVGALMNTSEVALSAAPYPFNLDLARLAIEAGCHFSDLGGNTEILRKQIALSGEAAAAGVTAAPDMGLAPGMVDVLAAEGVRRLDPARSVRMYVGGLPRDPEPPLGYQVVYSLKGALDYYTTPSWILRDGEPARVDALSGLEPLESGALGTLEAFHTGGGASLLPWTFRGEVDELYYKTVRYPGHAHIMRAIRELGLLSEEAVEVKGERVVPRDLFLACVTPRLTRPDAPDVVFLRVEVEGDRAGEDHEQRAGDRDGGRGEAGPGEPVRLVWDLLDRRDPETGMSAMERTTGFSLAIAGLFLGRGVIDRRGVFPAFEAVPYAPYLEALAARGIEVALHEEAGEPQPG